MRLDPQVVKCLIGDGDFLIDIEDSWILYEYNYYIHETKPGAGCKYVRCHKKGSKKNERVYLHRLITNANKNDIVDHINGNKLDNRRLNLRFVCHSLNALNSKKTEGITSSQFKGVYFDKARNKYRAYCCGKFIGRFLNESDAAEAYNKFVRNMVGNIECMVNNIC
jgi:hypothetical protein